MFYSPILLNEEDITIIVSPLNALMIDQVSPHWKPLPLRNVNKSLQAKASKVSTVAVCSEMFGELRPDDIYKVSIDFYTFNFTVHQVQAIMAGKYEVISPEIVISTVFCNTVLSKAHSIQNSELFVLMRYIISVFGVVQASDQLGLL
jgi:hypothetical protein